MNKYSPLQLLRYVKGSRKKLLLLIAPLIGFLLTLPSLKNGYFLDDHFFRQCNLENTGFHQREIWDKFNFISSVEELQNYREIGVFGWWVPDEFRMNFFRPLSSIIYSGMFTFWHTTPWVMHLVTILLYALLVYIAALVYKRLSVSTLVFGLGALLFAVDDAHAYSSGWISGINTLLTVITGLGSLLMHDTWRVKKWLPGAVLSSLLYVLSLLSSEGGVATAAFITAYAFFYEENRFWKQMKSVLPCLCISILYFLFHVFSNINAERYSSALLFSPTIIGTIVKMISNIILMVFFQVTSFPPARNAFAVLPGNLIIISLLCIAGLWVFRKLLKENRHARFYTAAMIMAAIPFSIHGCQDRLLIWSGMAAFGLLGEAFQFYRKAFNKNILQNIVLGILIFSNFFVSLFFYIPTLSTYKEFDFYSKVIEKSVAFSNTVFVNVPLEQYCLFPAAIRYARYQIWPEHLYLLYAGRNPIRIKKIDNCTIEVNAPEGWCASSFARSFIPTGYRFEKGYSIQLKKMTVTVTECSSNGFPVQVRFYIPDGLASFSWIRWGKYGPATMELPEVNCEIVVEHTQ